MFLARESTLERGRDSTLRGEKVHLVGRESALETEGEKNYLRESTNESGERRKKVLLWRENALEKSERKHSSKSGDKGMCPFIRGLPSCESETQWR